MPTAVTPADRLVHAALRQLANQQHQHNDDANEFTVSALRLGDRVAQRIGLTDQQAQAAFARLLATGAVRLVDSRGPAEHPKHARRFRFADDSDATTSTSSASTTTSSARTSYVCRDCHAPIGWRTARRSGRCASCSAQVGQRHAHQQWHKRGGSAGDEFDPYAVA